MVKLTKHSSIIKNEITSCLERIYIFGIVESFDRIDRIYSILLKLTIIYVCVITMVICHNV